MLRTDTGTGAFVLFFALLSNQHLVVLFQNELAFLSSKKKASNETAKESIHNNMKKSNENEKSGKTSFVLKHGGQPNEDTIFPRIMIKKNLLLPTI